MRRAIERQRRLDCDSVSQVVLNLNCRDELIPILRGLQQVYATPEVRDAILKLVERDVSAKSRADRGRDGLSYWCILVLAAVRLGCNLDYDKLHDLAENHDELAKLVKLPCLPKPGCKQVAAQLGDQSAAASLTFRVAKQRHPSIESAIGGLQFGNGQKRCRDRGELDLERYLALGILGRNLHTFGRLLIQREAPQSEAARTQRAT